jgi:phosphatidyl-myo-inositol dimannoside synthase
VLLENVYSRVQNGSVTALIDAATCGAPRHSAIEVIPTTISPAAWGLFAPTSWPHHLRLARELYRFSARGRAVVHCGRAQPEGIAAYLASYWPGGAPYVFWAHGEDISAALSSRQFSATMRLVYGRSSAAIANSRNTARLIEQTGWVRGAIDVIYPGVDSTRFHPSADDGSRRSSLARKGEILLLSVARLMRRKGHDLVLRALPELLLRHPVRYAIVGGGPEMDNLKRLAGELGVETAVHFTGEILDPTSLPLTYSSFPHASIGQILRASESCSWKRQLPEQWR